VCITLTSVYSRSFFLGLTRRHFPKGKRQCNACGVHGISGHFYEYLDFKEMHAQLGTIGGVAQV
jgi:hypothetical protein